MDGQGYLEDILDKICKKILQECERNGSIIPYIPENGRYKDMADSDIAWWTNGFFAGLLWQLYNVTGNHTYRSIAEDIEKKLDRAIDEYEGLYHDVGFMWMHTAVADYKLTGNKQSRVRGLKMANLLAGRYNVAGEFIRAWNGDMTGWMIVDCLMNLPLLYWASGEINDPRYMLMGKKHADTAIRYIVREDGSCNHIAIIDPYTGELLDLPAGQGYGKGSSWSRGQAWAVYGFALSYRYTGDKKYLDTAMKVADYFIDNIKKTDYVSLCDFKAPKEPVYYDSTAGVIAACGLIEIEHHLREINQDTKKAEEYGDIAYKIVEATEKRFGNWSDEQDGMIMMGKASYHGLGGDHHVNIIYGDFFFTEAVIKLISKNKDIVNNKEFNIW